MRDVLQSFHLKAHSTPPAYKTIDMVLGRVYYCHYSLPATLGLQHQSL
jgi:hypothetical protein